MTEPTAIHPPTPKTKWLSRTVLGVGLASLMSDWSHEMATAMLPALLISLGAGPGWLGVIEGVADGLSSFAKLAAGHWTDRLHRRKPLVVAGYAITAAATGAIGFAASALQVMTARCAAWLARGVRTPGRKALLAAAVPRDAYGRAFGLERMMDTLGAIAAPATALWLLSIPFRPPTIHRVFLPWTLRLPGALAALFFAVLVHEPPSARASSNSFFAVTSAAVCRRAFAGFWCRWESSGWETSPTLC